MERLQFLVELIGQLIPPSWTSNFVQTGSMRRVSIYIAKRNCGKPNPHTAWKDRGIRIGANRIDYSFLEGTD
jgi:hypothetical protein